MKILYDMSTGRIIEGPGKTRNQSPISAGDIHQLPELRLQGIDNDLSKPQRITPDLALMDPDQFVQEMN